MPSYIQMARNTAAAQLADSSTAYFLPIGLLGSTGSTETNNDLRARAAYNWSNLIVRCTAKSGTASVVVRGRVNAATPSPTVSVSFTGTGTVSDTSNQMSIASGDRYTLQWDASAQSHGNTNDIDLVSCALGTASADHPILAGVTSAGASLSTGTTYYALTAGGQPNTTTNTTATELTVPAAVTTTNLRVTVSAITNGTSTINSFKNGSAGSQTVSVTATGETEDTANSDSYTAGQTRNTQLVVGGSMNNLVVRTLSYKTTNPKQSTGLSPTSGPSTAIYYAYGGLGENATESNVDEEVRPSTEFSNLHIYVTSHSGSNRDLTFRDDGANAGPTVTINGTGSFTDTSNTATPAAGSLCNFLLSAGSATISIRYTVIQSGASSVPPTTQPIMMRWGGVRDMRNIPRPGSTFGRSW